MPGGFNRAALRPWLATRFLHVVKRLPPAVESRPPIAIQTGFHSSTMCRREFAWPTSHGEIAAIAPAVHHTAKIQRLELKHAGPAG